MQRPALQFLQERPIIDVGRKLIAYSTWTKSALILKQFRHNVYRDTTTGAKLSEKDVTCLLIIS